MSKAYAKNIHQAEPFWQVDSLWAILAGSEDTDNSLTVIWEQCPKNGGPGSHYHDQHEAFFVLEGSITFLADGETLVVGASSFVWIPKGSVHAFRVDSEQATLLNFYTPAGFEQTILQFATRAKSFTLPPKDFHDPMDQQRMMKLFDQIGCI